MARNNPLRSVRALEEKRGLRERKKQQTRVARSQVAPRLFAERRRDRVTLAEVAAAAAVSVHTIFASFPTQEALLFAGGEELAALPARIARERAALLRQPLREETGAKQGDATAQEFAAMVTGLLWMGVQEMRKRLRAGEPSLRAARLRLCARGFAMLRAGTAGCCTRPGRQETKEPDEKSAPRVAGSRKKK